MGSIEDSRGELVGLGDAVEAYTQEAIAAADKEQFISLPDRLERAAELARELGQLLTGIEVDMHAYGEAMLPYSVLVVDNPNSITTPLIERAKSIVEEHGTASMQKIPQIIDLKMAGGAAHHIGRNCSRYAEHFSSYREQLRKIGDRTEWLSERLNGPWSQEKLVSEMQSGYAEVKRIIASPGL